MKNMGAPSAVCYAVVTGRAFRTSAIAPFVRSLRSLPNAFGGTPIPSPGRKDRLEIILFIAVGTAAVVFGIALVINRPGAVTVGFH